MRKKTRRDKIIAREDLVVGVCRSADLSRLDCHMDNPATKENGQITDLQKRTYNVSFKFSTGITFYTFCMTVSREMVRSTAFVAGLNSAIVFAR